MRTRNILALHSRSPPPFPIHGLDIYSLLLAQVKLWAKAMLSSIYLLSRSGSCICTPFFCQPSLCVQVNHTLQIASSVIEIFPCRSPTTNLGAGDHISSHDISTMRHEIGACQQLYRCKFVRRKSYAVIVMSFLRKDHVQLLADSR